MKLYVPYASIPLVDGALSEIAREIGVTVEKEFKPTKTKIRKAAYDRAGKPHVTVSFKLRSIKGNDTYRKFSNERRTVGVCWHGHKMFMERLFFHFPDATLITALAKYYGRDSFNELHWGTNDSQWNHRSHCQCWMYTTDNQGLTTYLSDS